MRPPLLSIDSALLSSQNSSRAEQMPVHEIFYGQAFPAFTLNLEQSDRPFSCRDNNPFFGYFFYLSGSAGCLIFFFYFRSPYFEHFILKKGIGSGPGGVSAHHTLDVCGSLVPVDTPVLLFQAWGIGHAVVGLWLGYDPA